MKALPLALVLLSLPLLSSADQASDAAKASRADSIPVTISAKGDEVRKVLMSLFDQEKKQYVIEAETRYPVYLSLENADFHRALDIVCNLAGLQAELRDGIYFVHTARKSEVKPQPTVPTPAQTPTPTQTLVIQHPAAPKPVKPVVLGPLPASALQKHVTTRFKKTAIRDLFAEFSKQSGVKIVVDGKVPAYKLDAYLINTSLRYALSSVTKAAGLAWKLPTDQTVLITVEAPKPGMAVIHS